MAQDQRDLLELLKAELAFVQSGAYRNPHHAAWRPQFVFQDSPTCLNFDSAKPRRPCSECALMRFVPAQAAGTRFPCRYIPLNEQQETINSFYRSGTQQELEAAVLNWLTTTIAKLEAEKTPASSSVDPDIHVKATANP